MSDTLPAAPRRTGSLAAVLASSLATVAPELRDDVVTDSFGLPPADRIVVALVDGLGFDALRARAGHARTLAADLSRRRAIPSGFPTTTATALASFATGSLAGTHGLTGYSAIDRDRRRTVNLLHGWDDAMGADAPHERSWQRSRTLFERADAAAVAAIAVGPPRFRATPFTHAVLRGADYRSASTIADRVDAALSALREPGPGIVYLYIPELDGVGHAQGVESPEWTAVLEEVDAQLDRLARGLGRRSGMLVTADHGMLDIPHASHVLFDERPELVTGVRHVAGESRMLQLGLDDASRADEVAARWRDAEGHRAWIATRDEAIAAGWFGPRVDDAVRPRIGDVLVAARGRIAYYDGRADPKPRGMIGQHGSLDPAEVRVPLLRFGAISD